MIANVEHNNLADAFDAAALAIIDGAAHGITDPRQAGAVLSSIAWTADLPPAHQVAIGALLSYIERQ